MMTDIVERLRICAKYDPDQAEAADLIERLRKRDGFIEKLDEQIVSLNKEIERLVEALSKIADGSMSDNADDACYDLMKIARLALENKND